MLTTSVAADSIRAYLTLLDQDMAELAQK